VLFTGSPSVPPGPAPSAKRRSLPRSGWSSSKRRFPACPEWRCCVSS